MKRWYGKVLGFIAGALLLRASPLFGGLVGLLVGHAFDAGWFSTSRRKADWKPGGAARSGHAPDDPYRVLGVAEHASDAELDLAYRRRISQVHPDRFGGASAELRREAEAKAREINAAYDRIRALRQRG